MYKQKSTQCWEECLLLEIKIVDTYHILNLVKTSPASSSVRLLQKENLHSVSSHTHTHTHTPSCLPGDPTTSLLRGLECHKAGSHSCAHPPFSMCESVCMCVDLGQCLRVRVYRLFGLGPVRVPVVYLVSMTFLSISTSLLYKFPAWLQLTQANKHGLICHCG